MVKCGESSMGCSVVKNGLLLTCPSDVMTRLFNTRRTGDHAITRRGRR